MKKFYLVTYKGKFSIIQDELFETDLVVGKISKEDAISESKFRKEMANYYGVPAAITKDKDLNKIYEII